MLRIGVIGVNGIGQAHLWGLHNVEGVELAAACDIDVARANSAAEQHKVPAFSDAAALFASGAVDAVVVATPPGTHSDLVRQALAAGMHVYCEKPIAPTSDEGYALGDAARAAQRVLHIGLQFRYHKGYAALRDAVAGITPLRRVHVTATNWFRAQQYFRASAWRGTWRIAGGGVLLSQAVHQIDALVASVGMPARVDATMRRAAHDAEVEDEAIAHLEWVDGARGTIVASLTEPAGTERFEVVGEQGAVVLVDGYDVRVARHDRIAHLIDECPDEFPETPPEWQVLDIPRAKSEWFDMLLDSHREFAAAIADGRTSSLDATEGTKSIELVNAIYLSACTGEPVDLPLAKGAFTPVYEDLVAGRRVLGS